MDVNKEFEADRQAFADAEMRKDAVPDPRDALLVEAYRALQQALACGFNEEPAGSGFTPSKQETKAANASQTITDLLSRLRAAGYSS